MSVPILSTALLRYKASGLLLPGASQDRIAAVEKRLGASLPADLAEFYRAADGFADMDDNCFIIYSTMQVEDEVDGRHRMRVPPGYFLFSDYMTWCWGYAINLKEGEDHGRVLLIGTADGTTPTVARSFSEFLALVIRDAPEIYPPG